MTCGLSVLIYLVEMFPPAYDLSPRVRDTGSEAVIDSPPVKHNTVPCKTLNRKARFDLNH